MKNVLLIIIVLSYLSLWGCAASREIKAKSTSQRTDVFSEVIDGDSPPSGFCDLEIVAQFKTTPPGYYPLESKNPAIYSFVINIDGQSVTWDVSGKPDNTPRFGANGQRTIEGGEGMRYYLQNKLRLLCGQHNVFFALSSENIFKVVEAALKKDKMSLLRFNPVYNRGMPKLRQFRTPDHWEGPYYMKGLKDFDVEFLILEKDIYEVTT
jgi:hypothetical protein